MRSTPFLLVLAAAGMAVLTSCNGDRSGPAAPTRPSANVALELVAPPTLAPGATAQLRVTARQASGATQDVTSTVSWRSSARDVLEIGPDGVARALGIGDASVTAVLDALMVTREIVVVPEGTFRVVGRVFDAASSSLPVSGARVEVVEVVLSALTDAGGNYRLYGVPPRSRLRVSRDGFQTVELSLDLSDHRIENVSLSRNRPVRDPSGTYDMTFQLSAECRGRIPDELLLRRYRVTIEFTSAGRVAGTLEGATFALGSNVVRGVAGENYLELRFDYDYYFYYSGAADLVEVVDPQTSLLLWSLPSAILAPSGNGYAGGFNGAAILFDGPHSSRRQRAGCYAPDHRLTLTR